MPIYKVVECYPQATIRLIYRVEAESEDAIREEFQHGLIKDGATVDDEPADWGKLTDTAIDYGDYYTESITKIES